MASWIHLTKKEWRLGLLPFLLPLIAFIVVGGIAFFVGNREGMGFEVLTGFTVLTIGTQLLYLPYYLFCSLYAERKTMHLWLHSPHPGAMLVSAKFAAGLLAMVITLAFTGVIGFISLHFSANIPYDLPWTQILKIGLFSGIHLILLSFALAMTFTLFWMIFLFLNRFFHTFVSFIMTFITFVVVMTGYSFFANSAIYERLTMWGKIELTNFLDELIVQTSAETGTEVTTNIGHIDLFIGTYVFETISVLLIFFIACWILDKKVEV